MIPDLNDTIEAVARAICNSAEADDYDRMREGIDKDLYRQQARAALSVIAMRALTVDFKTIRDTVYAEGDDVWTSPTSLVNILARLLIPSAPVVEGPAEEIGTGLYRLADGEVVGREPEAVER